jgi:radical SAM superfamily enzyme YgiQ (UPF0313 family)
MAVSRNILLIHPWIYDFTAYDFWVKPLGLLYVAALLEKHTRHRLSFVDCLDRSHPGLRRPVRSKPDGPFPKETVPKPRILARVPRRFSRYGIPIPLFEEALGRVPRPDAVLMTCGMTYWYPGVQAAIDLVRRRFGAVPVILGGIYASLCPKHAASQSGADVVAVGPAETSLFPALSKVLGDTAVPDVPPSPGLASLPPPSFGMLRDRSWLPVLTSRGCPFRCTFCASRLLAARFEQRTPASVAAEIESHRARFGTRDFSFYDDALLVNKERHIVPLLERLVAAAVPLRFHTPNGLHLRAIDPPLARLLRRAGFASLYLSLESTDPCLLREKTPKASPEELAPALAALESAGYRRRDIGVYLIAGLPGQDAASVKESVGFVRSLGATPRVAFFSPIPRTDEWAGLSSRGLVTDETDPLLHNKLAFAYLKADFAPDGFEGLRRFLTEAWDSPP